MKSLYEAVYTEQVDTVARLLREGADPNSCDGEAGWLDSNPLMVLAGGFYNTYYKRQRGAEIPCPIPDVATLELLASAGADINRRPYIWYRIYLRCDTEFLQIKVQRKADGESIEMEDMKNQIDNYIEDTTRIIKAFIDAGADVDMRGDPYPFALRWKSLSDSQANGYFAKGSRPINLAIEKGMIWESLVDLLLQYTSLDEDSLFAAQKSGDPKMIEKIERLWGICH